METPVNIIIISTNGHQSVVYNTPFYFMIDIHIMTKESIYTVNTLTDLHLCIFKFLVY